MMTMSKPLSAGQAQRYHHEQLRDVGENYYSEGQEILGEIGVGRACAPPPSEPDGRVSRIRLSS